MKARCLLPSCTLLHRQTMRWSSRLTAKGVTALTLDGIPRISRAQAMDALTSMSTVAGYKAVLMAANRLPKFMPMIGSAVGMIPPATVTVIGTGVAGLRQWQLQRGLAPWLTR